MPYRRATLALLLLSALPAPPRASACLRVPVPGELRHSRAGSLVSENPAARPAGIGPHRSARGAWEALPLAFEPNVGQAGRGPDFVARGRAWTLALARGEARLALAAGPSRSDEVRMSFVAAAPSEGEGIDPLPGRSHYLVGSDPSRWRRDVPQWRKVRYRDVYPGIDLVYYGVGGAVEYDLLLDPGADPAAVRLRISGGGRARLAPTGELRIATRGGELVLHAPRAYQEIDAKRNAVPARLVAVGGGDFRFEIGSYRRDVALVIDPVLSYSTSFGGSKSDSGAGIAVDSSGNAYLTGTTSSPNFPTTPGVVNSTGGNIFVAKLAPNGASLVYSTYLGGTGDDEALAIGVDPIGAAYVTGRTSSIDFPTTSDALRGTKAGAYDAFVTKLTPGGATLGYSTYVGGAGDDVARAIAVDASGNAYLGGSTTSTDFPTTTGAFRTILAGGTDAFAGKLNPFGTRFLYASYLGGSAADAAHAIAVDATGNAYVAGETSSSSFPSTTGAFQFAKRAGMDAFVAAFNPSGSSLVYGTFLGGEGNDNARGIAVDRSGTVIVAGATTSMLFPTTPGAYQAGGRAGGSAFVTKLSAAGSTALYSTYLRWSVAESAAAIGVDAAGAAWVAGRTASADLPVSSDAAQKTFGSAALYTTTSGGETWEAVPSALGPYVTVALAIDPVDPAVVYAGTDAGGLFKSTDSGKKWSAANSGLTDLSVLSIAIDPLNSATVYAGTSSGGVFKSTDRGATWSRMSSGLPAAGTGFQPINALVIDPVTPTILYAGTGNGVYRTTDAASTWADSSNNLLDKRVTALAIDPTKPITLYAAIGRLGVSKSFDSGVIWNVVNLGLPAAEIPSIAIDPKTPSTVYAALSGQGVYKTVNGGSSWVARNVGLLAGETPNVTAIAMDPNFTSRVYAATSNKGIYKSFDNAATWGPVNTGLVNPTVYALAVHPTNPLIVHAGARGGDDVFVVQLSPSGTALQYATYAGGAGNDYPNALALDGSGGVYVTGTTVSPNFLRTTGAFRTTVTGSEVFVIRIGADPPPIQLTLFPQVAVGNGYTTIFTLSNTGSSEATGTLTLKDQIGEPLLVTLTESGATPGPQASSFSVTVASGATKVLMADRPTATDTRTGWARIETTGGGLGGVSTFRYSEGGVLKTIAGVLASQPVASATIPVDNDEAASRFTGFAVANHNSENIDIRIVTLSESGAIVDSITPVDLNSLPPGRQAAKFLHEYLPARGKFRGSFVLSASGGKKFGVVALVQDRGLLTAIPVVAGKAPHVP